MEVAAPPGAVSITHVVSKKKERHIRGFLAFVLVGMAFLIYDVPTRLVIVPLGWVARWREPVFRWWMWLGRNIVLQVMRWVGGARFDIQPRVPCRGGELILLNHQSLMDIPVVFAIVPDGYPRIVTNARYGKGIPGVSILLRVYKHLLVKLGDRSQKQLQRLKEFAATSEHPVLIFPEGHRTRDGNPLRWKKAGLRIMMRTRKWRIHVCVLDGLWESLSILDFIRNVSKVRCVVQTVAIHEFDPERDDADALIAQMEQEMCAKLAAIRGQSPGAEPEDAVDGRETGN
jgi:1-acyl-sn-glycerol-3-phosphate acyltransferase